MNIYIKEIALIVSLVFFIACGSESALVPSTPSDKFDYNIGHDWLTLEDSKRDNIPITAELFYPSKIGGEQGAIIDATFPLIIFAHGYSQLYSDYQYLWEELVKNGYILLFLTTQQGITINIDSYADDITFLLESLLDSNADYESIIKGHFTHKTALMGHSTGGGAIYLSQASQAQSTTLISLAALGELYGPISGSSPIEAAKNITASSLVLSGDKDCITPPNINQKPLYDNLGGAKTMVTIIGGDHCGFTNSLTCTLAESASCGVIFQGSTIDENKQRTLSSKLILSWLNHYLKDEPDAGNSFKSLLDDKSVTHEMNLD